MSKNLELSVNNGEKNKKLTAALNLLMEDIVAELPSVGKPEEPIVHSERYEKRIARLLKHGGNLYYRMTSTTKQQILIASAVMLILLNALLFSNVDIRAAVIGFFTEHFEIFSRITYRETSTLTTIEEYYEPSYVPEGYEVYSREDWGTEYWIVYKNMYGDMVEYRQRVVIDNYISMDNENATTETIEFNNGKALVVVDEKNYSLQWDYAYYEFLVVGKNKAEIIKVATSIEIQ